MPQCPRNTLPIAETHTLRFAGPATAVEGVNLAARLIGIVASTVHQNSGTAGCRIRLAHAADTVSIVALGIEQKGMA